MKSMNPKRVREIRDDVQAVINKVNHLLRTEDQALSEVVTDLLSCARYVLKLHLPKESETPQRRTRLYDQDEEENGQAEPDDPSDAKPKRDLRKDWSGPLPQVKRGRVGVDVDSRGISGGDADVYETAIGNPDDVCPQCRGPISGHAVDKNAPVDRDGFKPRIACDRTRVYCGPVDN